MNYLLPAQTLLDLCDQQANSARLWASGVDTTALRVSVISVAEARAAIDGVPSSQARARLDANLSALLSQIEADSEEPLAFDDQHANVWRALLNDPNLQGLGATDRQVYATAMHEGLTVVEESHAQTAALQALGVSIQIL
jgi:predicted nucleic acid-binding protein